MAKMRQIMVVVDTVFGSLSAGRTAIVIGFPVSLQQARVWTRSKIRTQRLTGFEVLLLHQFPSVAGSHRYLTRHLTGSEVRLLRSPLRKSVFILTDIDFYRWLEAPATEVQFALSGG